MSRLHNIGNPPCTQCIKLPICQPSGAKCRDFRAYELGKKTFPERMPTIQYAQACHIQDLRKDAADHG